MKRKYLFIVDIDGVVNTMGQKFKRSKASSVEPMEGAREVLEDLKNEGAKITYLTGRSGEYLIHITKKWLEGNQFPDADSTIFFYQGDGNWTWEGYLKFKIEEIIAITKKNPQYTPVILDDHADVLNKMQNIGFNTFLVTKPNDWKKLRAALHRLEER